MRRLVLLLGLLVLGAAAPAGSQERVLRAVVGPDGLSLFDEAGAPVTRLAPGPVTIAVEDVSEHESFRLFGPGVERHTQRHIALRTTWLVQLQEGVYHYFSDRRPGALRGSVTVGSGRPAGPGRMLRGITGSDFAIALVGADGAPVASLPPGDYTIEVDDLSPDHNFHLDGPGVDVTTTLSDTGRRTLTARLTGGTYAFFCDPHTQTMLATFDVPRAPATATRLVVTLSRAGRVTLPARTLRPGLYDLVVRDLSRAAGFILRGPGVRRATGASFVGSVTWRVRLRRGEYRYGVQGRLSTLRVR